MHAQYGGELTACMYVALQLASVPLYSICFTVSKVVPPNIAREKTHHTLAQRP
jgi:hypothetical protein